MHILIVKTSSLGDIIQTFDVLTYLHDRIPGVKIDWIAAKQFNPLLEAHPLVHRAIPFCLKTLRKTKYDVVFDLQGNCKSAFFTLFARAKDKVGRGKKSVREWPNLLVTHHHFDPPPHLNIRLQYINLVQQYFNDPTPPYLRPIRLRLTEPLPSLPSGPRVMVCLGSRWPNKQLSLSTTLAFLRLLPSYSFLLLWGSEGEKTDCQFLQSHLPNAVIIPKMSLPTWQNLMYEVDLVLSVDSAALHLCGTTSTASYGIFGPTSSKIFAPLNAMTYQGTCPYHQQFLKQCPYLRVCPTGACMKMVSAEALISRLERRAHQQQNEQHVAVSAESPLQLVPTCPEQHQQLP